MVITAYRCHPFAVLRGGTITGVLGELLGHQIGMSNGKGGSMHTFTPRFFGGNGIVGAQVPVGAGIAFAQKYLERPSSLVPFFSRPLLLPPPDPRHHRPFGPWPTRSLPVPTSQATMYEARISPALVPPSAPVSAPAPHLPLLSSRHHV
jgi:hypothetical protein